MVVDMVPFFVEEMEYCRGIVPNIGRLASSLRHLGGTVAWVLPGPGRGSSLDLEFYGREAAAAYQRSGGEGPLHERLWHEFDVDDADLLVEKSASSAFFPGRSPLPGLLEERGIESVIITGAVTNVCCESSARDASTLGYRVILVADANAARRDQDHNATLYTVYRSFGDLPIVRRRPFDSRCAGPDRGSCQIALSSAGSSAPSADERVRGDSTQALRGRRARWCRVASRGATEPDRQSGRQTPSVPERPRDG